MQDKAFEIIFGEYNRMITAYAYSLTGDWDLALDLTQDAFVVAYKKMDDFDPSRSIAAWLRGIVKNLARNALRKASRSRLFLMEGHEIEETFAAIDERDDGGNWEEHVGALQQCLEKLPPRQRQAVDLFYLSEKPARDVAGVLGVLEKTVFQFLWQARKSLRQCMNTVMQQEAAYHGR